jgi:hypothetical protein
MICACAVTLRERISSAAEPNGLEHRSAIGPFAEEREFFVRLGDRSLLLRLAK